MAEIKEQVGVSDRLKNNTTYKLYFKNRDRMVLESLQVLPFIRMYFNSFINEKELDIINYFLEYDRNLDQHMLYFDTLENVEGIRIKQIVDYIKEKSNRNSNINLDFIKGYIITNQTAEEKEQDNKKDNVINDLLDNAGIENLENILKVATAVYLLSIIKDFTE